MDHHGTYTQLREYPVPDARLPMFHGKSSTGRGPHVNLDSTVGLFACSTWKMISTTHHACCVALEDWCLLTTTCSFRDPPRVHVIGKQKVTASTDDLDHPMARVEVPVTIA